MRNIFRTVTFIIIVIFNRNVSVMTTKSKVECGYKQCPQTRDGALNVHLIPHSHMDAGWVKTFDEYYYGTKNTISTANVQLIYHSVLSELLHDKRRKFTFSETAYFWRWWKEQRPVTRATFRSLIQEGRIEFAGGGWVQNDEALLDYLQIIDQYTWGLRKINDTLGQCGKPRAGWQIDAYGHTREHASLLAQMGYDGLFIGRVDHKERVAMVEEDRMEFMWRGSDVLGKMSDIMTHTMFNLYNPPEGFCFDFLCNDEPIVDDPDNRVYNADKRVNDFIAQIERQAKYYDHDNIVVTMGGDFTYQSAANWFTNMDKLINHVNTHPANMSDINIFYSTPSCYLKAIYLYGRRDKAIYTERNDHIPYGSDASTYWTGYYTSRPSIKYLARRAHVFLQVMKQLTVLSQTGDSYELHLLRHAVSLVLHHDAITGTSQQHVINDFIQTLTEAIEACSKKISNLLSYLTPTWVGTRRSKSSQQFVICHQLNMSQCRFTETQETMLLLIYNPLSVKTYHFVRIPAIALHYSIKDANDEEVEYQLLPLPAAVINLPGRSSPTIQEMCFEAENIPPLGYTSFYVTPIRDQLEENAYAKKQLDKNADMEQDLAPQISNEYLKVSVNKDTGLLESIHHVDGIKIQVSQNFYFYSQSRHNQQSGAYSFRPEGDRPTPVTDRTVYHTVKGTLVKEIRQRFCDWITQIIRLYRGEEFVELEWIVGPVPIGSDVGKEVVTIFKTNITNNGEFYTDSNSRQMLKRSCWNETASQLKKKPIAACYYPITSRLCIHSLNTSVEMCVLTDRAQGGTSFNEGELELMVHRRLLTDDGFGLEEHLNEEAFELGLVVRGKHRILFENYKQVLDDMTFAERISQASRRWLMEPWLFLTNGEKVSRRKWQNIRNKRYSILRIHGLPRHVHVLTLEPWKAGSVLLRLENTLEKSVRNNLQPDKTATPEDYISKSSHITVELHKLFQLQIKSVRETTLAANQWLDDARQMDWSTRYVYSGGDDDILPEDMDYGDDKTNKPTDRKDSEQESNEETHNNYREKKHSLRQRHSQKGRSKHKLPPKYGNYDRRKRDLNISRSSIENVINGSDDNPKMENKQLNKVNDTTRNYKEFAANKEIGVDNLNIKPDNTLINKTSSNDTLTTKLPITKKTKRLSYSSPKIKPIDVFSDIAKSNEEFVSSEEDFSYNMKKRSPKRNNRRSNNFNKQRETEDLDDDITKSIYEMYYKIKPRANPFKPFLRSSIEVTEEPEPEFRRSKKRGSRRSKQSKNYENTPQSYESNNREAKNRNNRKNKGPAADMPFFITNNDRKYKQKRRDFGQNNVGNRRRVNDDVENFEENVQTKKDTIPRSELANLRAKRRKVYLTSESDEFDGDFFDDGSEEELEEPDRDEMRRQENIRRKRTISKTEDQQTDASSETEQVDQDFIITLRPTQIRTFVVWFDNVKKHPS